MPEAKKIGLVSLGCAKNLIDSELMMGLLKDSGYELTSRKEQADVLIVNTCSFIGPAKEESIDTILEMAQMKDQGNCKALVVAGCLAQRYPQELLDEMPEVDAVLGTSDFPQIVSIVERVLEGQRVKEVGKPAYQYDRDLPRLPAHPGLSAYLKISEGCDHTCTFCIIPALRGMHRSRPPEAIEQEARALVAAGVRELNLIAQDTTAYGMDLDGKRHLADLLRRLDGIEDLAWMRLLYAYPTLVTPDLVEAVANLPRVAKYVDIPLQHASDRVLKAMQRGGNRALYLELVRRFREAVPDIVLRTTFIVGFPGETEEDFEELLDFMRQARFDNVGIFTYSQEEDTPAGERKDQIPEEVKQGRRDRAMALQQKIAFERNQRWVGQTLPVLIESVEDGRVIGRIPGQAPDIDGVTLLHVRRSGRGAEAGAGAQASAGTGAAAVLRPQTLATVRITGVAGYDLVGDVVLAAEADSIPLRVL